MSILMQMRRRQSKVSKGRSSQKRPFGQVSGASENTRLKRFSSSRIEELDQESALEIDTASDQDENGIQAFSEISDEDSNTQDHVVANPYNQLLRSLNSKGENQAKKKHEKPLHSKPEKAPDAVKFDIDRGYDTESHNVEVGDELEGAADHDLSESDNAEDDLECNDDPFEGHFTHIAKQDLSRMIKERQLSTWPLSRAKSIAGWKSLLIAPPGHDEKKQPHESFDHSTWIQNFRIKRKLQPGATRMLSNGNELLGCIGAHIFTYKDVLFCDRSLALASDLHSIVSLHALNHIFKTRDRVIKNSIKIAKAAESEDLECRDQGFTRPKVLFLLPTRQACVRVLNTMLDLCEPEQQENKKRFQESYNQTQDDISNDKPEDFRELFAGNDDDMFRLGLKFTRKNVKFFSQFYNSDMIFASPLGLRMAIGAEESKKQEYDYLSSIELVIADQADAMLMQNWEHVEYVIDRLNHQPKEAHGCDFSRVRNWYLNGQAQHLRQTIILTSYNTPEINGLFSRHMLNVAGRIRIGKQKYQGALSGIGLQLRQTFSRFEAKEPAEDPDARFHYFGNTIVPRLARCSKAAAGEGQGILVFIPSYMDFVRIRNFLANSAVTQNISFGSISEYTLSRDVARARSHFHTGRHSVLLYTGRTHHFRRYRIRGVKQVIMYALPDNPIFYTEIAGDFLGRSIAEGTIEHNEASVRTLFSKWDALKLERIVGTERFVSMVKDKGSDTFDFK